MLWCLLKDSPRLSGQWVGQRAPPTPPQTTTQRLTVGTESVLFLSTFAGLLTSPLFSLGFARGCFPIMLIYLSLVLLPSLLFSSNVSAVSSSSAS